MFRVGKWAVGSQSLFSFSSHTHKKINETSIYGYKSPRYINCSVRLGKQEDPNSRSCPTAVGLKGLLTQLNHLIRYLLEQSSGLFVMTCCVQWNYSREIIDIHKQTTGTCYLRWIFKHSGCQNDSVVCALVCLRLLYVCLCVRTSADTYRRRRRFSPNQRSVLTARVLEVCILGPGNEIHTLYKYPKSSCINVTHPFLM